LLNINYQVILINLPLTGRHLHMIVDRHI
jgi:hypothetical protein